MDNNNKTPRQQLHECLLAARAAKAPGEIGIRMFNVHCALYWRRASRMQ